MFKYVIKIFCKLRKYHFSNIKLHLNFQMPKYITKCTSMRKNNLFLLLKYIVGNSILLYVLYISHFSKCFLFLFHNQIGLTWVNDDRIFLLGWTIPLNLFSLWQASTTPLQPHSNGLKPPSEPLQPHSNAPVITQNLFREMKS